MTYPVFPDLPGASIGIKRTPVWRSSVQSSQSGKETPIAYMSYPLYQWSLDLNVLRNYGGLTEFSDMLGLVNACQGMAGRFLFADPEDNTVTGQPFGTGDGSTTQFQLVRSVGGYTEPVQMPVRQTDGADAAFAVEVAGTVTSITFPAGSYGIVQFASPPAEGSALTWSGTFRYLARFLSDTQQFQREFQRAWSTTDMQWQSVKL